MGAVTIANRYVVALGPLKVEIAYITSVDDADTYSALLQGALFGCFIPNTDGDSTRPEVGVAITNKAVVFNGTGLSADTGVLLLFGF